MKNIKLIAAALCVAAPSLALPTFASAHPHKHHHHSDRGWCGNCGHKKQRVAYRGDSIDGYHIPGYVFVYADKNGDGVLRGREISRAVNRAMREDWSDGDRQ